MWPRLISRGRVLGIAPRRPIESCFNVAAAHQPRKGQPFEY